MNLVMSRGKTRMPFLSTYFKFFFKKFRLHEKARKNLSKGTSLCHFKSQQHYPISFISYSDVSIFWLADVSSIFPFPIYLRYHPDGLGGSVKPAHHNVLFATGLR